MLMAVPFFMVHGSLISARNFFWALIELAALRHRSRTEEPTESWLEGAIVEQVGCPSNHLTPHSPHFLP